MTTIQRRLLLRTGAAAGAAIALSHAVPAVAQAPRIRRNVTSLSVTDPALQTYRKAVKAMMALPVSDRRSWVNQAKIHLNAPCPHSNWFFLPWHREYLLRFEGIVRQLGGDPSFNLPYWDWINDRQVPAAFWDLPNVTANPLNIANLNFLPLEGSDATLKAYNDYTGRVRGATSTTVIGDNVTFSRQRYHQDVINVNSFTDFASNAAGALNVQPGGATFEDSYHGEVHVSIAGPMRQMMSPLDPIFWLHHANVDRIWTVWRKNNPGVAYPSNWQNFQFNAGMFADSTGAGTPARKVGDLQDSEALGYVYEASPTDPVLPAPTVGLGVNAGAGGPVEAFSIQGLNKISLNRAAALGVTLPAASFARILPSPATKPIATAESLLPASAPVKPRTRARLKFKDVPANPADIIYRLFLNCTYLTPETPSSDPHFVGTLSMFGKDRVPGVDSPHNHDEAVRLVDLTNTIEALSRLGVPQSGNTLNVQVQALPRPGAKSLPTEALTLTGLEVDIL
jgi:tyrosinase